MFAADDPLPDREGLFGQPLAFSESPANELVSRQTVLDLAVHQALPFRAGFQHVARANVEPLRARELCLAVMDLSEQQEEPRRLQRILSIRRLTNRQSALRLRARRAERAGAPELIR
jgi:hypothetical protein